MRDSTTLCIIFIFCLSVGATYYVYNNYVTCTTEYATVQSIRSADAGGLLTSSQCVYVTDKGDFVEPCAYNTGDKIEIDWECTPK